MPLTLTLSENALPRDRVKEAVQRLTDSMLAWHELSGNSVMTPNVTANVHIVPEGLSFSGGDEFSAVWIEHLVDVISEAADASTAQA